METGQFRRASIDVISLKTELARSMGYTTSMQDQINLLQDIRRGHPINVAARWIVFAAEHDFDYVFRPYLQGLDQDRIPDLPERQRDRPILTEVPMTPSETDEYLWVTSFIARLGRIDRIPSMVILNDFIALCVSLKYL